MVEAALRADGWTILARRARAGRAELDLVAVDPGPPRTLVIVEVRWRRRRDYGLAEETVLAGKLAVLRRGVGRLLQAGALADGTPLPALPARLDLVAVEPSPAGGRPRLRHHRAIDGS